MFDRMLEITVNKDFEKRIQKTEQENYATRVERANRTSPSILARLGESLIHLGFHLQRRPHKSLHEVVVPR